MKWPRPSLLQLIGAEISKLLGRRWTLLVAVAAPAIAVALSALVRAVESARMAITAGLPAADAWGVETAFQPAAAALGTGSLVAALLSGAAGALALAEERRLGTLRTLLAGPVPRWRFFVAKVVGLALAACVLVGAASLVALAAGALRGDYVAGAEWEYEGHTVAGMWEKLAIAVALSAAAAFTAACLGMLASALTGSGAPALILTAVAAAAIQGAQALGAPATRKLTTALSPTTYATRPAEFLGEQVACIRDSSWCIVLLPPENVGWEPWIPWIVCLGSAALFAGLGLIVFCRREVL